MNPGRTRLSGLVALSGLLALSPGSGWSGVAVPQDATGSPNPGAEPVLAEPRPLPAGTGARLVETTPRPEVVEEWRIQELHNFLRATVPGHPELSERQMRVLLLQLLRGDFSGISADLRPWTPTLATIANAVPNLSVSSVGLLLARWPNGDFVPTCTVVSTWPDSVLTAGHCLDGIDLDNGQGLKVFFQFEGYREPSGLPIFFTQERGSVAPASKLDDLAVIRLTHPLQFLPQAALGTSPDPQAEQPEIVWVEGFGYCYQPTGTGGGDLEFCGGNPLGNVGIRRAAKVIPAACGTCASSPDPPDRELCFRNLESSTDRPVAALDIDSGGPMSLVAGDKLVGIARTALKCLDGDDWLRGRYVEVADTFYGGWLQQHAFGAGKPAPDRCDGRTIELAETERLPAHGSVPYTFAVPKDAKTVILTLNHEIGISSNRVDFDLVLPAGWQPSAHCSAYWGTESCSVSVSSGPVGEAFSFAVQRVDWCGIDTGDRVPPDEQSCPKRTFQVTAVSLPCSPPGRRTGMPLAGRSAALSASERQGPDPAGEETIPDMQRP